MSVNKKRQTAAFISIFVSFLVLLWKFKAYYATNSSAVLSDALETVANVITSFAALYAVKMAAEPADENHPYGHGKAEHFSAAFEGGLIFFAGLTIIYNAIQYFVSGARIENIETGIQYSLLASFVNLVTGFYLIKIGKTENSAALKASGNHLLSDVITTVGVIVSLVLYNLTGLTWIDPAVSFLLGFWLIFQAYKIMRINSGALMDEADEHLIEQLSQVIDKNKIPGVIDIHNLRMIRSGNFHHIDAHMVVPQFWTVDQVHTMSHDFEKAVVKAYEFDGEFAFHIDPCLQKYCTFCNVEPCDIRKSKFQGLRKMTRTHLKSGPQSDQQEPLL